MDASMFLLVLFSSLLVSQARAERLTLLAFGLLMGWLVFVIYMLVVLAGITVAQRIYVTSRGLADWE